jgi:hypothetical protein
MEARMSDLIITTGWYWVMFKASQRLEILRYTAFLEEKGMWQAFGDDFEYDAEDFVVWGPVATPQYLGCGWCNATGFKPNQTKMEHCPGCNGTGLYSVLEKLHGEKTEEENHARP